MSDDYIFGDDDDGNDFDMDGGQESSDGYSLSQQSNDTSGVRLGKGIAGASGSNKFYSLTSAEVMSQYIEPLAHKVANPLCLSQASAIFLLADNQWSDEKSITKYFEDEVKACKKAGLTPCPADAATASKKAAKTYACKVCFDTQDETMPGYALGCGHGVCEECWKNYFEAQLSGRGDRAWFSVCPDHGCKLPAAPVYDQFNEVASPPASSSSAATPSVSCSSIATCKSSSSSSPTLSSTTTTTTVIRTAPGTSSDANLTGSMSSLQASLSQSYKSRFEDRLVKLYTTNNSHMFTHCSNPTCDRYIYCGPARSTLPPRATGNVVKCTCNQQTCVRCENSNHLPATCENMKDWDSKEQADAANANWILANTKQCPNPKCRKAIEKNQGCNHMTCSQCRNEFCWICLGDWARHGSSYYACNKRADDPGRDSAANELERYIHYYTRYRNHEKSKALDGVTLTKARAKVEAMVRSGTARLHDADFWEKTAFTLMAARRTLAFSYVYAYYLPVKTEREKGAKELFEFQQGQLEHATEMLSEFVIASNTGEVSAQEVVARMSVAQQMLKNLEEGCMSEKK